MRKRFERVSSTVPTVDESIWRVHVSFARRGSGKDCATLVDYYDTHTRRLARRFDRQREPLEDLEQVALEALVVSLHRFEPERRSPFLAFADPTIVGSLKRHFRDNTWGMRVSRRVHELARPLAEATDRLRVELGRPATNEELARDLAIEVAVVEEVRRGTRARTHMPLTTKHDTTSDGADTEIAASELRIALDQTKALLTADDARVFGWYFEDGLRQTDIAERLGCSQMHVSRQLTRIATRLRQLLA